MTGGFTYNGKFNLILGCMWSGKSTELIRRHYRYKLAGKKCLMVKYAKDIRYDDSRVVTHDNLQVDSTSCNYLYEIDNRVIEYDVICIDEIQFYKDAHIIVDKWASMGKIVEACGLSGTFDRKPWNVISQLIPLTENITLLKAICKDNGKNAVYTDKKVGVDRNNVEDIGGTDKYCCVDRGQFYKNKPFYTKDKVNEFITIYLQSKDINVHCSKVVEYVDGLNIDDKMDLMEIAQNFIS